MALERDVSETICSLEHNGSRFAAAILKTTQADSHKHTQVEPWTQKSSPVHPIWNAVCSRWGSDQIASFHTLLFLSLILWLLLFFLLALCLHLSSASLPRSKKWTHGTDRRLFAIPWCCMDVSVCVDLMCVYVPVSKIDGHSCQVHTPYSLNAVPLLTWKRSSTPRPKSFLFGAAPVWDSLPPHIHQHTDKHTKLKEGFTPLNEPWERRQTENISVRASHLCLLLAEIRAGKNWIYFSIWFAKLGMLHYKLNLNVYCSFRLLH